MRVLHINTSDSIGGAAIAAMRLHKAMLSAGIDSTFFCLNRTINDDKRILTVNKKTRISSRTFDLIPMMLFRKVYLSNTQGLFSNMKIGYKLGEFLKLDDYDVIYIHWINNGFLSLKGLKEICKTQKKVFWFMHDMYPITGGCHHSFDCNKYKQNCSQQCLYLKKKRNNFANKQLKLKHKILAKYTNISFIAPSKWLYECAKSSLLANGHRVYYIPNLLDNTVFHPFNKDFSRDVLHLPKDKKIILFGADSALTNPYKGFDYLVAALSILKEKYNNIDFVIFGSSVNKEIERKISYPCHFFGYIHDVYTLSLLYNASDVFCMPSLAEAFGQTALESVFCGTPVVAFDVGGIPDFISGKTGYLAKYKDSVDFAHGIDVCLNMKFIENKSVIENCAASKVEKIHESIWS